MPHCVIEYSKELESEVDLASLLSSVYQGASDSKLFRVKDIKARAIPYTHYVSNTERQRFVHVTVKIVSGRSLEQRDALSRLLFGRLNKLFVSDVSLSVEIYEIEEGSYIKVIR